MGTPIVSLLTDGNQFLITCLPTDLPTHRCLLLFVFSGKLSYTLLPLRINVTLKVAHSDSWLIRRRAQGTHPWFSHSSVQQKHLGGLSQPFGFCWSELGPENVHF